jgi:hypothetical protein
MQAICYPEVFGTEKLLVNLKRPFEKWFCLGPATQFSVHCGQVPHRRRQIGILRAWHFFLNLQGLSV